MAPIAASAATVAAPTTSWSRTDGSSIQTQAVVGAQWGDEGKGKLVDILAAKADVCVRFNGGANAGHTLVVDGRKIAMHLLPCGMLHKTTANLLGNGVVIHLPTVEKELSHFEQSEPDVMKRVFLAKRAHLVFDFHKLVDGAIEATRAEEGHAIGTTRRGIGPAYSTKAERIGVRVCDLLQWPEFERNYRRLLAALRARHHIVYDAEEEELATHKRLAEKMRTQIVDSVVFMHDCLSSGKRILFEGANATMLDLDFGTYPFVTSSCTVVGGLCGGSPLPPRSLQGVVGVAKAYVTRVGEGPFPTEQQGEVGDHMRTRGGEFGTTTGRPRRCGWLDLPMLRLASCHQREPFTVWKGQGHRL
eukprot:GHVT01034344.1.p1 GENE.GHVT01034344.1~~GHVT01034344.1.p1  ORF type:complete len:360 (+),score=76.90 GHVT01034344.1:269-1348(+)